MGSRDICLFTQRGQGRFQRLCALALVVVACLADCQAACAAKLHLSWIETSFNEDGFEVERKTSVDGTFTRVATRSANQSFYDDEDVLAEVLYCYRVRAFNENGFSGYSNEACATPSSLLVQVESPENNQPVSGVAVIYGWGFDSRSDGKITSGGLFIDGVRVGDVPCCSPRSDVRAAFPEFPATSTENSGWGVTVNWGLLPAGPHTVQVQFSGVTGASLMTTPQLVTVVNPGEFVFLDLFSLTEATASIDGNDLVVAGVVVRDKATHRQRQVDVRFRWFTNAQALGLVEATVVADLPATQLFSVSSPSSSQLAPLAQTFSFSESQDTAGLVSAFERPEEAQAVAGIGVGQGWTFTKQPDVSIAEVRLLVDGVVKALIPCCSSRWDVAAAYPEFTQALQSGWGITLNYGLLNPGFHLLETQIRSSTGESMTLSRGVTSIRIGGSQFIDEFDLSGAKARIVDGALMAVESIRVRDKESGQRALVDVFFQWTQSSQALGVVSSRFSPAQ